jgi:hypothetical protein
MPRIIRSLSAMHWVSFGALLGLFRLFIRSLFDTNVAVLDSVLKLDFRAVSKLAFAQLLVSGAMVCDGICMCMCVCVCVCVCGYIRVRDHGL